MICIAREHSEQFPNIEFQLADVRDWPPFTFTPVPHLPRSSLTLYPFPFPLVPFTYLPFAEMLLKMKMALTPGGILLVLDLFGPEGLLDSLSNLLALPVSASLRLIHHGRLLPPREGRDAWTAHKRHDLYPTMTEVRALCASVLPGARIKKHLLWRYSLVWQKPG
jgi:hypothetical protein